VFLDTSLNFYENIKSVFLLYNDDELISVVSMLIPSQQEAEVSAFTLPQHRGNGYFKLLLSKAIKELQKFNIQDMLFVCEKQCISGKIVIESLNAHYAFTEYLLRFNNEGYKSEKTYRLLLRKAKLKDLDRIIDISMRGFDDSFEDAKARVDDCIESNLREQYLAVLDKQVIGLCSINLEEDEVSIFGLAIVPEYRRKGYGKELLHLIMDSLIQREKTKITLMVDHENTPALELYKQFGFQIAATFEYYRKDVGIEVIKEKSFPDIK